MDIAGWEACWRQGRIGFHEGQPNRFLARHVGRLGAARRVLVPLCGKTEDMAFLAARGLDVMGIEAVEDAPQAFFAEHGLTPAVREVRAGLRQYEAGRVTILVADVFTCTKADIGAVDALYDRAALVALPPEVRARYVPHLRAMLQPDATGLVITLEYGPGRFEPPPFSVSEAELRGLYEGAIVESLEERPAEGPRLREAGIDASERCSLITL